MNLFLIENDRTIDEFINRDIYDPRQDIVICVNYLVFARLKKESASHIFYFIEDLLTPKDYEKLHSISDEFAFNWYRYNGNDLTLYEGISYGDIVKITFSRKYMLSVLLKYGEVIRKAIEKWPAIETIYFDFSNLHNSFFIYEEDKGRFFNKQGLVKEICRQLNRKSYLLSPRSFIPSMYVANGPGDSDKKLRRRTALFLKGIFFKLNFVLLRAFKLKSIYFFCYPNIKSITEYISRQFILDECRGGSALNLKNIFNLRYFKFENLNYTLNEGEKKFLDYLRQDVFRGISEGRSDTKFIFNGLNYQAIYLPAIEDLTSNVIAGLLEYVGKIKKSIPLLKINKIIVNEEISETYQALLQACKLSKVESVWVDHGIQGHHHAQKVCARDKSDTVVCPGRYYVDYYAKQGGPGRRCVVLGNPSTDPYPADKMRKISRIKNVLFLGFEDNFYARLDRFAYQEKYYFEILSIFNDLLKLGINIYFKPYPSCRKEYFKYIFDFFNVDLLKIKYLEQIAFTKIIYDMDIVISNVSSCFYESQAAGIPTIFFEPKFIPDALLAPLNGINGQEVIRVSTGQELLNIIKKNKYSPDYLNSFIESFLKNDAPYYMGNLDGRAGKRICEFLCH